MCTANSKWKRDRDLVRALCSPADSWFARSGSDEASVAQHLVQRASLETAQQEGRQRILEIPLGLGTRSALGVNVEWFE